MSQLTYLQGYPENLLSQVRTLIAEQRLGAVLEKRYPGTHDFATDKALWQYTQDLKNQFLRNAPPLNKVMYDKAFYQLCCHMEPQYHQLEFDTRLWLTQQSLKQTA